MWLHATSINTGQRTNGKPYFVIQFTYKNLVLTSMGLNFENKDQGRCEVIEYLVQ